MPYVDEKNYDGEQPSSGNFMKLQQGENKIRIASQTFHFKKHGFKDSGKYSSKICQGEDCQFCAEGNEPKNRYSWIVIDRTDNGIKILEVGWQIYGQLLGYAKDEEYGDLKTYDAKIIRTGEGLETDYQVRVSPKHSEITEEEKKSVEESGIDLEKIFSGGKYGKVEKPEEPPVEEKI